MYEHVPNLRLPLPARCRAARPARAAQRGVVLLVVLVVVAMLALGAYSFVQLMNVEARAAQTFGRMVQARQAADSGVHYTAAILLDQKFNGILGTEVYDSYSLLHGQVVSDESADQPRERCRFSLVAPWENDDTSGSLRYGVFDESAKINLNAVLRMTASQDAQSSSSGNSSRSSSGAQATNPLLYLPNMTPEIADAILDWIDEDDTPRENGAESEYYQALNPPYQTRNGPLHTIDELLLVAGVTPRLLYGEDANRNGVLDLNEDDGELSYPFDDSNGMLDRGWLPYLTLFSRESNSDTWGTPRIQLNDQDLQKLYDTLADDSDFGQEYAEFIVAYRLFGAASSGNNSSNANSNSNQDSSNRDSNQNSQNPPNQNTTGSNSQNANTPTPNPNSSSANGQSQGDQSGSSQNSSTPQVIAGFDASGGPKQNVESVSDLIGITVDAKLPGNAGTRQLKSPFLENEVDDYLDMLLERTTTSEDKTLVGRINANTAPWPVLMALPGMTEELADAIIAARDGSEWSADAVSNLGVSWLLSSGTLSKEQFKSIEPFITGQTQVLRVQVVGYFEAGGPVVRIEAVIDLSGSSPRIRAWRDLTRLGRGFDPQVLRSTVTN